MVEVQTRVRVASGVKAIVVQAADRVEPLDSKCTSMLNRLYKELFLSLVFATCFQNC